MDLPSKARIRRTTRTVTQPWDPVVLNQSFVDDTRHHISSSLMAGQKERDPPPAIEVVTLVNAIHLPAATHHAEKSSSNDLYAASFTNARHEVIMIHSEALAQTIRDVVQFYPGQILTGSSLVIHEPFACLMHHMADLEDLLKQVGSIPQVDEVEALLEFLRPQFEQQYLTARKRLLNSQPTVKFEDIWILMQPGSLAYTQLNEQWIGCVIGESRRLPAIPNESLPERCITYWFFQVHWPSDQIGCVTGTVSIDQYGGEKLATALPIFPSALFDATDSGARKRRFTERGSKICDILWGDLKHFNYDGECLDQSKKSFQGRILIGGKATTEELYPEHDWDFSFVSPAEVMQRKHGVLLTEIESLLNPNSHSRDLLAEDQLFAISPCLSAFRLSEPDWVLISVENIQPLDIPEHCPAPFLREGKLESILSLVRLIDSKTETSKTGKGAGIMLHGPPGVGKSHTIDYVAMQTGRPLLTVNEKAMDSTRDSEIGLSEWFTLAEKWNALLVIDHADSTIFRPYGRDVEQVTLINALTTFKGIVFLTVNKLPYSEDKFLSRIALKVRFPHFDSQTQRDVWRAVEEKFENSDRRARLSQSAKEFLYSPETQVNWDGHEMNLCYQAAVASAVANPRSSSDSAEQGVVLDVEHLKEAMNSVHEFREYREELRRGGGPPPPPRMLTNRQIRRRIDDGDLISDESDSSSSEEDSKIPEPAYLPLASDSSLCIPSLNRLDWDAFQAAGGNRNLFRKTKFYAIDFLVGEPQIVLQSDKKTRRRRKVLDRGIAFASPGVPNADNQTELKSNTVELDSPLPERIRINSPAIVRAFSEAHEEQLPGSFLIFKPFVSLLYYEQDFRDWATQQEKITEDQQSENKTSDSSNQIQTGEANRSLESAALEEMECLLSFIDNHIKKRQAYLASPLCKTVAFSDLPLLFSPGDTVIGTDRKQAFRVIGVTNTRHRIKKPDENRSTFWRDSSKAEYADNPVHVHCVHVDYDGVFIGPVHSTFRIPRYDGVKDVSSLQVYPLRFAEDGNLRTNLIQRGKTFVQLAAIKHMHCTGFTLGTREEIDSQVVIDFEEAISRHPEWKPKIRPTATGLGPNGDADAEAPPKELEDEFFVNTGDSRVLKRVKRKRITKCVKECCRNETTHHEEYVGDRRWEEYIASQMGDNPSVTAPVTIFPRALAKINQHKALTDDDLLVVSYRVLGFALRSRKWYELDIASLSEVSVLGEGGFDQLVLPDGHGDLVKSMIRQHFRDKKLSAGNVDSSDIVRGKGRGLIMLLHGVPGVGKTSTAECIADLFRRPLFQITSGDLGLSAKEVEDTLNDNFNLASRWDSVLLIDEADVFLGERTKEDFVRNSLVAVFLRMMEYYSGVLFLTTNRVGVFDEAFTSRVHISLYYPPLDRDSTRKIFEKNWERIQARYEKNGRLVDTRVSEITEFALDYFDKNKEGRWNGRQIRNAFQSAVALAELDASGTDDLFSEVDHGHPVVLGKKSFDTVAKVYKSFLAYLKQVYGADYARRARENLWRFDAFGAPRMPNALTTRLAVSDPAQHPRGPDPSRTGQYREPWYDQREASRSYPPQQYYPDRYGNDYPSQRPPSEQRHYREVPRSMGPHPSEYHPPSTRPDDPRSEGYRDDRGFSQPGPHPEWAGRGGEGAGSGGYEAPTRYDPQHSQARYPSDSDHLSPFQGHDR